MPLRDKGVPVKLLWERAADVEELIEEAAVTLYLRNGFGPRKPTERLAFRASELGDIIAVRDPKDDSPIGCSLKPYYSFYEDEFPSAPWTAQAVMNFARGDEEEETVNRYLEVASELEKDHGFKLVATQTKLGAWGDPHDEKTPEYFRGHPDYPDQSGGLVRGKADFVVKHAKFATLPLEMKTISTYGFAKVCREGPKVENALQVLWYASEMQTDYAALVYRDKENGTLAVFVMKADPKLIAQVLKRAAALKKRILAKKRPMKPKGVRAPEYNENRFSGRKRLPPEPFYDRVWPCYTYASKKDVPMPCRFFKECWGELPKRPRKGASLPAHMKKRASKKAKATSKASAGAWS